jgi:mannosylglycerate hydrolase
VASRFGRAYIVSHTHWDREWYMTYHRFRVILVDVVGRVLDALEDDGPFEHFLMDGQTVILEDYLEARPDDAGRIERLVKEGKLSIGPWYVLPDEFLVSGEATVRNLLFGSTDDRFGPVQKVGYLPDSFGHIAQLPQILQLAGIDSFVYTRGNGDELEDTGLEYVWRGPDGSEVLAVNQWGGYCNASALGHRELWHAHTRREVEPGLAAERVGELFERLAERSNCDTALLMNGCDHHPPQREFGAILDSLESVFPEIQFVHGGLEDYVREVRESGGAARVHSGELLGGRYHHILSGVWSARMPIKQENDAAQTLLSGYMEPTASYTHFMLGRPYPQGLADYAWKLLLKNHPHDSICGCSTDEVHREMETRFAGVRETAEQVLARELEHLTPAFARRAEEDHDTVICVVNPLPFPRDEVVERLVVFQPPGPDTERLRLFDEAGEEVPFRILSRQYVERFWGIDYRGEIFSARQGDLFSKYVEHFGDRILREETDRERSDCFLTIQFLARSLPGLGHANFRLIHADGTDARSAGGRGERGDGPDVHPAPGAEGPGPVAVTGNRIENGLVSVTLHPDATLDVADLVSGTRYTGLNTYEDAGDAGDEYDYSPCEPAATVTSAGLSGEVRTTCDTGLVGRLEVRHELEIPVAAGAERATRKRDTVSCPLVTAVRVAADSPVVEIEVRFENRASDHRLRAVFPTGIGADSVVSDGHFFQNERRIAAERGGEDWVQPPPATYPQQAFSLVEDGKRGLALLNVGLPEIEAGRDEGGAAVLSLTLLRAVGWLSRDDFESRRRTNAGPTLHTPGAQCKGVHTFCYAVLPFSGDRLSAGVNARALGFRTPVLTKQGVVDGSTPGSSGLLSLEGGSVSVTAVKKHRSRDTLVVRAYNMSPHPAEAVLVFGRDVSRVWRVDILEERIEEWPVPDEGRVPVGFGPHEIVTVEIEFEEDDNTETGRT